MLVVLPVSIAMWKCAAWSAGPRRSPRASSNGTCPSRCGGRRPPGGAGPGASPRARRLPGSDADLRLGLCLRLRLRLRLGSGQGPGRASRGIAGSVTLTLDWVWHRHPTGGGHMTGPKSHRTNERITCVPQSRCPQRPGHRVLAHRHGRGPGPREPALPGAAELIQRWVDTSRRFLVLTNNSIFTPGISPHG